MNIAEMITLCHSRAKDKGFWDVPTTQGERFSLIVGELFEGLEAVRKGRVARDVLQTKHIENLQNTKTFSESQCAVFYNVIKDSFEDELADALIRLFDFCGGYTLFEPRNVFNDMFYEEIIQKNYMDSYGVFLDSLMKEVYVRDNPKTMCTVLYKNILAYCHYHNIDIWAFVDLKLKYNATREKLHGKKF